MMKKFLTLYFTSFASIFLTCLLQLCRADYQLSENTGIAEQRGYRKREHSLEKPYQASGLTIQNWDFVGSTIVTNDYIRLTADEKSMHGGLWNTVPVNSSDWEIILKLKVHGSTGDLFGDGMAIWYVKERDVFGNLTEVFGYKNNFDGLGVFVDTYSNHNGPHNHPHPYISAMVGNGEIKYDHDTDGTHTQLGNEGCTARLRNKEHDTQLMIRYVNDTLSVYTDIDDNHIWRKCLSVGGVRLPMNYYFGVSAATGDLTDAHELISFNTYEIDVARSEAEQAVLRDQIKPFAQFSAAPRDHVSIPRPSRLSGWLATFVVVLVLICLAAVIIVGVLVLQKRQESSRKRFY